MDSNEQKPGVSPETPGTSSYEPVNDATGQYNYYDDYGYEQQHDSPQAVEAANNNAVVPAPAAAPPSEPPPASSAKDEDDEDDDGMLRMSFLEHLEELRRRIISALIGVGVAFAACISFSEILWNTIRQPYVKAMAANGVANAKLAQLSPTEAFSIIWLKLPVLCAIFLASPWLLYQVWSFIAPGLYKHERRWAGPFVVGSASLFVIGGLFAYYVAFPLGLAFLLGIGGESQGVQVSVTITEYFDLFFNVTLGMGIVFELPILVFLLTLVRVVTPQFLVRNSRYAILLIVIIAAVITPTPDVINLMLISVPMTLLYFTGVFASYVLWLSREGRRLPWVAILAVFMGIIGLLTGSIYLLMTRYGYKLVYQWPFLVR